MNLVVVGKLNFNGKKYIFIPVKSQKNDYVMRKKKTNVKQEKNNWFMFEFHWIFCLLRIQNQNYFYKQIKLLWFKETLRQEWLKFLRWLDSQLKRSSLRFVNILTSVLWFNCQTKLSSTGTVLPSEVTLTVSEPWSYRICRKPY